MQTAVLNNLIKYNNKNCFSWIHFNQNKWPVYFLENMNFLIIPIHTLIQNTSTQVIKPPLAIATAALCNDDVHLSVAKMRTQKRNLLKN